MGYYTEYFSTLLKGLRITALKERIEVRRVINNLRKADHLLYKSLWENVEKEHRVTEAIKEENKLIEKLKKSADNVYSLIFNLSTEDMQLLKVIEDILKELEAFSKSIGTNAQLKKVERDIVLTIFQALKKAEDEEREEFKQVTTIINEAEEKNRNKFMANIRLAFQREEQQTILAKFAARAEIRKIKVDIIKLQKAQKDWQKIIGEMYGTIQEIKKYCNEAFKEMFYLKKRIMLLTLKILLDLNNLRTYNGEWTGKHFMPEGPIKEKNKEIDKIEDEISKHFHTIAQAFMIIITKIQKLEKEAEIDASQM